MRVYISGAQSCGKSTLARYISEYYNLPMVHEIARVILSEKEFSFDTLRANIGLVNDYQTEVFYRQLEAEEEHDSFVSDRTFDNLAYAGQHSQVLNKLITTKELQTYIESLKKSDVYIFFIRPNRGLMKQDGVRENLTWDGIVAIDAMIKFMFEMWDLKYYQINTDSLQERIKLVNSVIKL
jgi:dephospho-CoA kinase